MFLLIQSLMGTLVYSKTWILRTMLALNTIVRLYLQHADLISYGCMYHTGISGSSWGHSTFIFLKCVMLEIKHKSAIPLNYNTSHFKIVWDILFLNFCDLSQTWNSFACLPITWDFKHVALNCSWLLFYSFKIFHTVFSQMIL